MSTRCNVFLKIRPEDIGKPLVFDPSKTDADASFENAGAVSKWSKEENIVLDKTYACIYCHADGYPSATGNALLKYYDTYEKTLNLMAAGAVRYIDKISESFTDTKPGMRDNILVYDPLFIEYVYLFEDDTWYVLKTGDDYTYKRNDITYIKNDFTPLQDYLKMYPDE